MAKLYGEIASSALMTFDKSFARANGQPLDSTEIYYSLAAAEEYAAGAGAYVGQKIAVIENGVVTHYSIEDADGTLKELGSKPVGDGTTITITEDGKIRLANITDDKASGTYNAVLVNGQLTWVKPSETTVEGLSDLIAALTTRVGTAEGEIDALQAAVGVASKAESAEGADDAVAATGLHKTIEDEIARAKAAEEALGQRIDGIDFVDEAELSTALEPYATKQYVGDEIAKVEVPVLGVAAEDKVLALGADKLISATVAMSYDEENKAIKLTGKDGVELGSVDATPFIKDGMLDDVDYNPLTNTLTFTWNTSAGKQTDEVVLSDIIEPYTAGDGLELAGNQFAVKLVDGSESFLTLSADGLKLTGIQEAINAAKDEAVAAAATDAQTKADAAKNAAIADAATKYATTDTVSALETALDARLDVLEAYEHDTYATKTEVNEYKTEVANTYATQTQLTEVSTVANNAASKVETLEDKIDDITSVGGQPNVIEYIHVNGVNQAPVEKVVNLTVPTQFSDLTDDSGFDARITAAQTQADKGVEDAAAAKAAADAAAAVANANKDQLDTNTTKISNLETTVGQHTTKITDLESANTTHVAEFASLKSTVEGHTTAIAKKADQSSLDTVSAQAAGNATAIATINDTTLPALESKLQGNIDKKANSADVYTKDEVDGIIGEVEDGKTVVEMIKSSGYDDTEVRELIQTNTDNLATEILRAKAAEEANATEITRIDNALKAAIENDGEGLDSIKELATWIEEHGLEAADMAAAISANEDAIAAINNEDTGILAQANKYTDEQIAAIPAATAEALGLVKVDNTTIKAEDGVISVMAVSTDLLTQGKDELILNGGSASV